MQAKSGDDDPRMLDESPSGVGLCGRGLVPGGSKELKLRLVDEGPGGGGEELVGAGVARRRRPAHAGREPQRR